jgi:hypothetical protein
VFTLTYLTSWQQASWAGLLASALLLTGVFWAQGRRVTRTHYRRERWTWRDITSAVACLAVLAILVTARILDSATLQYYPYAALLPPFQPWLGGGLLLLITQALFQGSLSSSSRDHAPSQEATYLR